MGRHESLKGKTTITSYGGAAGTVTGSCHVLETKGFKGAFDLGIFQGKRDDKIIDGVSRNDSCATEILRGTESIILTHSHIDHSGRIPWAFAKGFEPRVYATKQTVDFSKVLLKDSVKVQKSQLRDRQFNNKNKNKQVTPQKVLYDENNVDAMFRRTTGFNSFKEIPIGNNITIEFISNGHIEGSSSVLVRNYNNNKNILFTGDIGRPIQALCGGYLDFADKYPQDPIHAIVIESTNFEKEPVSIEESQKKLLELINETTTKGGNVALPLIATHRYAEMKEFLHHSQNEGKISSRIKFIDDGPLPKKVEEIYRPEYLTSRYGNDPFFYKTDEESMARFDLRNLTTIDSHKQSMAMAMELANGGHQAVVLASGGMGDHGRSVNYLNGDFARNSKNAIITTCYQAEGSFGSKSINTEKANYYHLGGFTGHAVQSEYIDYMKKFNLKELETIEFVHGKLSSIEKFAEESKKIWEGVTVVCPKIKEPVVIFN